MANSCLDGDAFDDDCESQELAIEVKTWRKFEEQFIKVYLCVHYFNRNIFNDESDQCIAANHSLCNDE